MEGDVLERELVKDGLKSEDFRSRPRRGMAFYRKHIINILRIKRHAATMILGEKIIFQGALKIIRQDHIYASDSRR